VATKYATHRQVQDTERELRDLKRVKNDPYLYGSVPNKPDFAKREKEVEDRLTRIKPPGVSASERKRLESRNELLEEFIRGKADEIRKPAMPTKQQMWDSPAGAVGQHRMWQDRVNNFTVGEDGKAGRAKGGYGAMSEWKDNCRRLADDEQREMDPDISSPEQLRPDKRDQSSFADYRKLNFSPGVGIPQEKWDEAVGTVPVAGQCERLRKDGKACTAPAMTGHDCCLAHSKQAGE
jgi:hypothetical protein